MELQTTRGPILIRCTGAADAEALFALRLEALRNHPTSFGADTDSTETDGVEIWRQRAARSSTDANDAIFVASAADSLVGMTGIFKGTRIKEARAASIWGVYVREEWRGLGASTALMNAALDWARLRGVKVVRLTVMCENTAALRSYLRCGFHITGLSAGEIEWEGQFYDEILMCRWL